MRYQNQVTFSDIPPQSTNSDINILDLCNQLENSFHDRPETPAGHHTNQPPIHDIQESQPLPVKQVKLSDLSQLSEGMLVKFKGKDINSEWFGAKLINKAGKSSGKYKIHGISSEMDRRNT